MKIPIELKKSNKKVTARSGLGLFSHFMDCFQVKKLVDSIFQESRSNRGFAASSYVSTLLLNFLGGGETISDTKEIRDDSALRIITDSKTIPTESAIGDWLKRAAERDGVNNISIVNDEILAKTFKKSGLKKVSITIDPTIIKAEKRDAKRTYLGMKGYRPVVVLINELKLIVEYQFKEGNDNGRRLELIKKTVEKLNSLGISVNRVLADSEYYCVVIFNYLEQKNIEYAIVADKDCAIMENIDNIADDLWEPYETKDGMVTDRQIAPFVHSMERTNNAFKAVVLRWVNKKEETCYHVISSNIKGLSAKQIVWEYNKRADQENDIKELKNGFGMRKMPSSCFEANALFFGIGVLAYNLFVTAKLLWFPKKYRKKNHQNYSLVTF